MAPPSSAVGFTKRRMVSAVYQSKPTADDIGGFIETRQVAALTDTIDSTTRPQHV